MFRGRSMPGSSCRRRSPCAERDAGARTLESADTLELVRLFSAPMNGIVDRLATALPGLKSKPAFVYGHGNTPMLILNRAARRIASGQAETCVIAGAEAYRTEKRLATLAAGGRPDMMKKNLEGVAEDIRRIHGLVTPIEIYPLFENAMRAAWGQTLAQAQAESARSGRTFPPSRRAIPMPGSSAPTARPRYWRPVRETGSSAFPIQRSWSPTTA